MNAASVVLGARMIFHRLRVVMIKMEGKDGRRKIEEKRDGGLEGSGLVVGELVLPGMKGRAG